MSETKVYPVPPDWSADVKKRQDERHAIIESDPKRRIEERKPGPSIEPGDNIHSLDRIRHQSVPPPDRQQEVSIILRIVSSYT